MQQDYLMLQLLSQSANGGGNWLTAVLLLGLLLALLFKRERITNWALFRLSCWFFAASITIPPILNVLTNVTGARNPALQRSGDYMVVLCVYAIGPILLGTSIICALCSLIPSRYDTQVSPPRHPLEQN